MTAARAGTPTGFGGAYGSFNYAMTAACNKEPLSHTFLCVRLCVLVRRKLTLMRIGRGANNN